MTTTTQAFDATVFEAIKKTENFDATRKGANKEAIDEVNGQKVGIYASLVASICAVTLRKGNLPKAVADEFDTGMTSAGFDMSKRSGAGKRYRENSVGLARCFKNDKGIDIPTQATADYIRDIMEKNDLVSEAKIAAYINAGKGQYLMGEFEEVVKSVGAPTFGKDAKGRPVPTGMKQGGFFEEEKFNDLITAMHRRRDQIIAAMQAAEENDKSEKELSAVLAGLLKG